MSGYTKITESYSNVDWGRINMLPVEEFQDLEDCSMIFVDNINTFYLLGAIYDIRYMHIKLYKFYFPTDDSIIWELLTDQVIQIGSTFIEGHQLCFFENKIYTMFSCNPGSPYGAGAIAVYFDINHPENGFVALPNQIPKYGTPPDQFEFDGFFVNYNNNLHFLGTSVGYSSIFAHYVLNIDGTWQKIEDSVVYPGSHFANPSIRPDSSHVVYNNKLYMVIESEERDSQQQLIFYSNLFYWDEQTNEWTRESILPARDLYQKSLFDLNDHLVFYNPIISNLSYDPITLYQYDYSNEEWIELFDQTVTEYNVFTNAPAVLKDNRIYALNVQNGFYYLYQDIITALKRFERACISVPTDETVKRDGVPYVKYTNKMVRKAWVWGSLTEGQPNRWLLALDSADYFVYHSRTLPSGLPYDFYGGSSVIFDGKLHILGGRDNPNKHFSFNGTTWAEESTLPFNLTMDNRAVAYDGKIHVLGWKSGLDAHYSWDGTSWEQESELPYNLYGGCVATYNNKIHIIGGYDEWGYSKKHRVWDGTSWEEAIDAPYLIGQDSLCVIFNGKLRILAGSSVAPYKKDPGSAYYHYSWDDFIWARELDLDFSQPSKAVVCDNKLFIYEYNNYKSYLNLNNVWTKISTITPYNVEGTSMINYHDQINLLGGDQSRGQNVWNATENRWQEIKLPNLKDFYNGSAIIFDNKIHILGGTVDPRMHYSWDMDTDTLIWEEESRLPYDFNDGSKSGSVASVIYDDKIHIFGGRTASIRRNHYSWDGTAWTAEELLPYTGLAMGDAVIFRNQIHVLGITTPNQASSGPINIINHFKWDDHDPEHPGWLFQSKIPSGIGSNFRVVVWNDAIHIIGKTKHYSWTPETLTWKEESTLPYEQPAEAIVVGNYIRIMGSELNESEAVNCYYGKYVKDKFTWTKYDDLLVGYDSGSAVMGRILYLLSGKKSYNSDVVQTTNDGKFK